MSPLQQNIIPNEVSLRDLFDQFKKELLLGFNSHHIGTIQSFNSSEQTAIAQVVYTQTVFSLNSLTGLYTSSEISYPLLFDCPVECLGGGTASLTFPIQSGDECIVHFNDRDIGNWWATGTTGSQVATANLHNISDGIITVGVRSFPNSLLNYSSTQAQLRNGTGGTTVVGVSSTHVNIANSLFTLNGLLQTLISNVKDLVTATAAITVTPGSFTVSAAPGPVTGVSGSPVNASDINNAATELTATATKIGQLLL